MTYEEILNANGGYQAKSAKTPFGSIERKLKDGKFREMFVIDSKWSAIPAFRQGLQDDCKFSLHLQSKQQLRYEIVEGDNGILELELEQGSYQTLEQTLETTPALVAQSEFVDGVVEGLLTIMEQLHARSVYHICFSPRNVFIRKGDNMPMLLLHGSAFSGMRNEMSLFEDLDDFIAPELKNDGVATAQSDIYSLGQLILWIFRQGNLPYEYKKVAEKAMQTNPQHRFASAEKMMKQLNSLHDKKRSFIMLVAALIISAVCIGLYFELTPQTKEREFIEAAPKTPPVDEYADGYDPEFDEVLVGDSDEVDTLTAEEQKVIDDYMKKAEEIFRKRLAMKADGILSKVYNSESMNASEKTFRATSSAMSEELVKLQNELAEETGISDAAADRIASEVIGRIISEKEKAMTPNINKE